MVQLRALVHITRAYVGLPLTPCPRDGRRGFDAKRHFQAGDFSPPAPTMGQVVFLTDTDTDTEP